MKPILFSTPMVQAILEGRKTQTRRVVKINGSPITSPYETLELCNDGLIYCSVYSMTGGWHFCGYYQPPYKPGDVLWVRETWCYISDWADVDPDVGIFDGYIYKANWPNNAEHPKWRPSIHMPKEAARIFLRVKAVRVERLQDITVQDAKSEGMFEPYIASETGYETEMMGQFRDLWDSLYAKRDYCWDANPWVWVMEFERISKGEVSACVEY